MDCERFDQITLDALYEELDDVQALAVRRHLEGCVRCKALWSELSATRETGVLPLEEPSADLEARILAATAEAQRNAPWPRRVQRTLAWAGSQAMRPQLASAALLVLILGSSVLLLRPKGDVSRAPVRVTERGVPAPEAPAMEAFSPTPAAAPSVEAKADSATRGAAMEPTGSGQGAASAALAEARALRSSAGCEAAIGSLQGVSAQYPGQPAANEARWDAAECYESMGDTAKARALYAVLATSDAYADRARARLEGSATTRDGIAAARPSRTLAAPKPAAAPTAAAAADSPAPAVKAGPATKAEDADSGRFATPPKPAP